MNNPKLCNTRLRTTVARQGQHAVFKIKNKSRTSDFKAISKTVSVEIWLKMVQLAYSLAYRLATRRITWQTRRHFGNESKT